MQAHVRLQIHKLGMRLSITAVSACDPLLLHSCFAGSYSWKIWLWRRPDVAFPRWQTCCLKAFGELHTTHGVRDKQDQGGLLRIFAESECRIVPNPINMKNGEKIKRLDKTDSLLIRERAVCCSLPCMLCW